MSLILFLDAKMADFMVLIIKIYQKTISLDHGPLKSLKPFGQCRFRPTCSEYSITAYQKMGFLKGSFKTMWRLIRCNPFNHGGYDPL